MTSVAIIFDNFGPYHLARLQAASAVCDLLAIEVAGQSAVYAWDNDAKAVNFSRVTLIERATSSDVSRAELIRRLEETLEKFKPAVVIVPGWASPAAWGSMRWCLRSNIPMVCMSESTAWDEPRTGWKEWIKRRLVRLFGGALVGGQRHRDYLVTLGVPEDRIFFGYDAVDNRYFGERAAEIGLRAEAMRQHYALPTRYFLASARFVEKKNLPRFLEAYSLYRASPNVPKPWSLVLLGDGALRPALELQRDVLGLREHVLMPGFKQIADLPAYYALAGAFIHPSTVEPWGLVVNEAMSCGLPVLVSNRCGCAPELVHEGENGFTFNPLDVNEMAQMMRKVSAADFPPKKFRQSSLKIISQWGPERFAQGVLRAVESAMAKSRVQPTWIDQALLGVLLRR
jgi:glycosyltransferase involved in cell wall biosynthesis